METYCRVRFGQIGSDPVVVYAMEELERYLKKMNSDLVIDFLEIEEYNSTFENIIWVGMDYALKVPVVSNALLDDVIVVDVKNGSGYISGSNPRSVLMAVYRFLKELGCQWVRPGAEGERIPKTIPDHWDIHVEEKASYRHRGVCIEGADTYENIKDMIDYLPKVGMNEYFIQFIVPGIFFKRWYHHWDNPYLEEKPITREEIAAITVKLEKEIAKRGLRYHKVGHGWTCEPFGIDGTGWESDREYTVSEEARQHLAQVNGVRGLWDNIPLNTELCYSNPETRKVVTDAITSYAVKNPNVQVIHFWLSDGNNNYCECENCRKKQPADWYMTILNELDEKLTAAGLDTKIVFLLYHGLLWEPQEVQLKNPERFILMYAPISRVYGQNYANALQYDEELPKFELNHAKMPESLAQNLAHLRRWQEQFQGDSFAFDYHLMWAHMSDPGYEKCAKNLFQDMKDLHTIGLDGMVSCQIQRCFFPTALPFNMMAAALWNENSDYEEQVDAYYKAAYGEDGVQVRKALCRISDHLFMYDAPSRGWVEPPYSDNYEEVLDAVQSLQQRIRQHVEIRDVYHEEWMLLQLYTEYVSQLVQAYRYQEMGMYDECHTIMEELYDWMCRNELQMQKVLDVHNNIGVQKSRLK